MFRRSYRSGTVSELRNVGGRDRVLRGVLGIWLVVVGVAAFQDDARERGAIATIAGLGLLQNALTGFCGANFLFGIDTTAESRPNR